MVVKRRNLVNRQGGAPAPQRCLYGIHPVSEWLRSRPSDLSAVHYDRGAGRRVAAIVEMAHRAGIPVHCDTERALADLAGTGKHQGLVAMARPFPYVSLDEVLREVPHLLVVGDQLQDPQNLGALLRTAAAVGAGAVVLPRDGAVGVTSAVEAAGAGAAAVVPVCRVTNVARTLRDLKQAGYWSVGLVPMGGTNLYKVALPEPVVVVIGGEAGVRPLVARECDFAVTIPMCRRVESLNASVAAAVVLYEIVRRRDASTDERGGEEIPGGCLDRA